MYGFVELFICGKTEQKKSNAEQFIFPRSVSLLCCINVIIQKKGGNVNRNIHIPKFIATFVAAYKMRQG